LLVFKKQNRIWNNIANLHLKFLKTDLGSKGCSGGGGELIQTQKDQLKERALDFLAMTAL
jgi:hypothetical protein